MGTLTDKLTYLNNTKTAIKEALIEKGVDVADSDPFRGYADKIREISGSGGSEAGGYLVQVVDYDGRVIKEAQLGEGEVFTLPNAPIHDRLVFQEWSSPVDITDNSVTVGKSDITIGAVYTTASGLSEFDIELTKTTGLSVTLNTDGTKDWGDGTIDELTTHTYSEYGEYTITCNATVLGSNVMGQNNSNYNYCLKSVRLSNNITTIPNAALWCCQSLESVTIPNVVTRLNNYAFSDCYSLKSAIIPNNAINLGSELFNACYSLKSVTIPKGVTTLWTSLFYRCYSLRSVTIPSSVTIIKDAIFKECCSLKSITIPNNVTIFGNEVFNGCNSLENVMIQGNINQIGSSSFSNCYSLKDITLPDTVTKIDSNAFYYCKALRSITIPSSVTSLGSSLFQSCYSLEDIKIQGNTPKIGSNMFYFCYVLNEIKVPSDVTSIDVGAFSNCTSVTLYDFSELKEVPTLASTNAFDKISKVAKIVVPTELYDDWVKATNWATYKDYIYSVLDIELADWNKEIVREATCTEEGLVKYTNPTTEETIERTIAAKGHSYNNMGKCEACGNQLAEATYTITETAEGSTYGFINDGNDVYVSNNGGKPNAANAAKATLTINSDGFVCINWEVGSEKNYDKFSISLNGINTDVREKSGKESGTLALEVVTGDVFVFTYSKDSGGDSNGDFAKFTIGKEIS